MKKSSILSAVLFLLGVLVGGTSVFYFVRSPNMATQPTQTSEPVTTGEVSQEQMPALIEETDEIPLPPDERGVERREAVPLDDENMPTDTPADTSVE